jgi:RimK family alpha-L-glutamate ligase
MQIGFISQIYVKENIDRFRMAAKKMGIGLSVLHPAPLTLHIKGRELIFLDSELKKVRVDGVINWDPYPAFGVFEQACNYLGIPFINSTDAARTARNKTLTSLALLAEGLPQPETIYLNKYAKKLPVTLPLPVIYKPKTGTQGRGGRKFVDRKALQAFISTDTAQKDIYLQKFIPNKGWDLRVVVVGDNVIGATKRTAKAGEWKTSATFGGRIQPFLLNEPLKKLALRTASAIKLNFAGIDIIQNSMNGSYMILEVNATPRLKTFEDNTGVSIAKAVLEEIVKAAK